VLVVSLFAGLALIFSDLFMIHGSEEITRAAELLLKGPLSKQFWFLAVGLGIIAPILLILWPNGSLLLSTLASLLALAGLWTYENLWITAGQAVPLS
jgi:formate-dependent nitrite reductase membrane component NrfD